MMSASSQIYWLCAILFTSLLLITQFTLAVKNTVDGADEENALAVPAEMIKKHIEEFLGKLGELKKNPPKIVEAKNIIYCEETQVTMEYLEKIHAFLKFLKELTEKMNFYREHYPSFATFAEIHAECSQSIDNMTTMQKLNDPYKTTLYSKMVDFLEKKVLFSDIKGNGVIDDQVNLLREKIVEYLASLPVKNLILNYHVHSLTIIASIFKGYAKIYERKYAHFYKAANHFVSTLTTEKRDEIQLNLENMEKKMAARNLPEMEKELQIKKEIFKYLEEGYYQKMDGSSADSVAHQTHVLLNSATGQLVKDLLEIHRSILAGHKPDAKILETTWILAERIVIPAFDYYAETSKIAAKVTTCLKQKMSLPQEWIDSEIGIMYDFQQNDDDINQAKIRYNTGYVLLTYLTLANDSTLFKFALNDGFKEAEKKLTKTFSNSVLRASKPDVPEERKHVDKKHSDMEKVGNHGLGVGIGTSKKTVNRVIDTSKVIGTSEKEHEPAEVIGNVGKKHDHQDCSSYLHYHNLIYSIF